MKHNTFTKSQEPRAKNTTLAGLFLLICIFFINSRTINAQYELARPINNQLRNMFSQITYPDATVEFLYHRSANMIDSTLYDHVNPDTIHTQQWNQIYKEMFLVKLSTKTSSVSKRLIIQ